MRSLSIVSSLVIFALACFADDRPNVLLIVADDLNSYMARDMGVEVKTPYLDQLLEQSIFFDKANCAAPVCTPSRAALFSGLYPHTTGVYKNGSDFWTKSETLQTSTPLPSLFNQSGYVTFGRGKLTHDGSVNDYHEDMWSIPLHGTGGFGPFPEKEFQLGGKFFSVAEWDGPELDFPDVKATDHAIEFIRNHDGENPFMMMIGLWRPHNPWTAPRRFFDLYDPAEIQFPTGYVEGDLDDVPPLGIEYSEVFASRWKNSGASAPDRWRHVIHGYLACTSFADWTTGRVIEALDQSPFGENTIVIFTSDNGYQLGEKHHYGKGTLWEPSAIVPLSIRLPGSKNQGTTCPAPVNLVDLYPTLKELCSLNAPPQQLDGISLVPLLEDPESEWDHTALTSYDENMSSVRDHEWRYIRYRDGTEELYHIETDPFELTNQAKNPKMKPIIERLRDGLPDSFATSVGGKGS